MSCGSRKHAEVLTSLLEVMKDGTFSDIRVTLKDGQVSTSRSVLAVMSPVFRQMLTNRTREGEERREVGLDEVTLASWKVVVSFYLGDEEPVTKDNLEDIAKIADRYDMPSLKDRCSVVVCENVSVENCFAMLDLARACRLVDAVGPVISFMRRNFGAVSLSAEFRSQPQSLLMDLLERSLYVVSEDTVAIAVLSWLEENQVDDDTVATLFDLVKLDSVSWPFLFERFLHNPLLSSCTALNDRVTQEIRNRCAAPASRHGEYERRPVHSSDIVIVGSCEQTMRVFASDEALEEWTPLRAEACGKGFAACLLDGSIYVTGGENTGKTTYVYSVENNSWHRGPDLVQQRWEHAMANIGQTLYAVAGTDGSDLLSIEECQLASCAWSTLGNLMLRTRSCGAAAIGSTLIVVGGVTSAAQKVIQAFNTITREASVIEARSTSVELRTRGVTLPDRAVFVCQDGDLVTVKRSAEGTPTVKHTQLHGFDRRELFGLLVDSRVRVFGGGDHEYPGSTLTRFALNGGMEEWDAAPLPVPLRVYGAFRCTVPSLRNVGI